MYAGIDPGKGGAVALFDDGGKYYAVHDIPLFGTRGVIDPGGLRKILRDNRVCVAYVEKLHAMPKNGSISSFSLGHSAGVVEAVLEVLGIEVHFVSPQRWKGSMGLIGKPKDAARKLAGIWFGDDELKRVKDVDRADAMLICQYGLELHKVVKRK